MRLLRLDLPGMTVLIPRALRTSVTKRIGVISFIGDKLSDSGYQAHAGFSHNAVGRVARRHYEYPWTALIIDNRMDLAIPAAFGEAYRLRLRPPFPPLAQRWIFT
jgi:hypothetical protein